MMARFFHLSAPWGAALTALAMGMLVLGCTVGASAPPSESPPSESPPSEAPPDTPLGTKWVPAELATVGFDAYSGAPVVLLRELVSGRVLPIWIGPAEARAISLALHGVEAPRPMTHDLMVDLIAELDAELEEVVVSELRESTFFGLLKFRLGGEEVRWVDTRPSDGLALAVRTGASIRVNAALLETQTEFRFIAPDAPDQVVHALGLTVAAASPELIAEFGLPERPGAVVIAAQGQAAAQGLLRGDLIVALDGEPVAEPLDLLDAVGRLGAGETLAVTFWRDGEERTVELVLELMAPERRREQRVA